MLCIEVCLYLQSSETLTFDMTLAAYFDRTRSVTHKRHGESFIVVRSELWNILCARIRPWPH
jgi:hypothetical protein